YITNTVKDPDGRWISPYNISNGANYVDGCALWDLPVYTNEVSYKFSEFIIVRETEAIFVGTVIQPMQNEDLCIHV
ncbi:Ig-like domain-containing protein, partial [Listeria monocytogenes]|uniref:Ig-like domain-containing protein n=1 Tax=Listeria monocytogenes TaxID=1639 RepID=UPI0023E32A43